MEDLEREELHGGLTGRRFRPFRSPWLSMGVKSGRRWV